MNDPMDDPRTWDYDVEPDKPSRFLPCGCVLCGTCYGAGGVWEYDPRQGFYDRVSCPEHCDGGKVEICEACQRCDEDNWI